MAVVRLVLEKEGQVIYDVEVAESFWKLGGKSWLFEMCYVDIPSQRVLSFRNYLRPYIDRHFIDEVWAVNLGPKYWGPARRKFHALSEPDTQFRDYVIERYSPTRTECELIAKLNHLQGIHGVFDDDDIRILSGARDLRRLSCIVTSSVNRDLKAKSRTYGRPFMDALNHDNEGVEWVPSSQKKP